MKLKREVGRVTDDVMSLSRDFKYDFLKVRPDVFEPRVVDRQTFKKEVSCKDPPRSKHKPTAVPMQDVYADAPPSANNGQVPLTMMWPADEEFVPPGVMPAADLGNAGDSSDLGIQEVDVRGPADRMPKSPTMESTEEITVVSSGPEPTGITSSPMGYESPYIRALMADTSTEAIRSDGYVFDFDCYWDEEEEGVEEATSKQTERTREYNLVVFDLSEPAEIKEPNLVVFDLTEQKEAQKPNLVVFDLSEQAEEKTKMPNFILFDNSEPAEIKEPNLVVFDLSEPMAEKIGTPNFVLVDDSEPAEIKEPNFVVFDLSEPMAEKIGTPNFILVYPSEEASTEFPDEGRGMMELTIPEIATDSMELEDSFSEELFPDDDSNLAPMLGEDHPAVVAEPYAKSSDPAVGHIREQPENPSLNEGIEVSFGFLSGTSEAKGESGINFVFGTEECQDLPTHNFETQTSRDAVKVSNIQAQRMYL